MGLFYTLPSGEVGEHDLQIRFDNLAGTEMREPFLPAEWHQQSGIQLTWPHEETDWAYMLGEVEECFVALAREIASRESLIIATPHVEQVSSRLKAEGINMDNVKLYDCPTNDTWARDHGAITMIEEGQPVLLDFTFNGWGLKFASDKDNQITRRLVEAGALCGRYSNHLGFVLEGGSIESDGAGTLLTTSECLLSPNRNAQMNRQDIEDYLKRTFRV
jgi:agmatine/peptidylarginine deiminase